MTRLLKNIFQRLVPYGVFRTGEAVYLTFDDGPIPEVTPKVLDILARYKVKTTFFMVGENVKKHPEVFEQVVKAGHSIGNHTYNHIKGWRYSTPSYLTNVELCEEALTSNPLTSNLLTPNPLFRPPYGKATWAQKRVLHWMGYRIIYWDILTKDYDARVTPEQMLAKIQQQVRPGSIINFHDSLKSNERMLTVLPQAIEWLQSQGYELKPL